jgi:hypothetical protein
MAQSMNGVDTITDGYATLEDGDLTCNNIDCSDIACSGVIKSNSLLAQTDTAISGDLGCINLVVGKSILATSIVASSITLNRQDIQSQLNKYVGMNNVDDRTLQTYVANIPTKVLYESTQHDTYFMYNTDNYFLPISRGYYYVNATYTFLATTKAYLSIYQNGIEQIRGSYTTNSSTGTVLSSVSGLLYCNGLTDKITIYGTSQLTTVGSVENYDGIFHIYKI